MARRRRSPTGYTWSQSAGTYTAVGAADSNALFADGWDDNQTTVTLPFTFNFNGIDYTQVTVSSNGFLVFGNTLNANNTGEAYVGGGDESGLYLGGTATNNGIAAFNADLDEQTYGTVTGSRTNGSTSITSVSSTTNLRVGMRLSGTGIPATAVITNISGSTVTMSEAATSTSSSNLTPRANAVALTTGSAPNRVFVVQFTRVLRFGFSNEEASFQIRLNEGGGDLADQTINMVYGTCSANNNNNSSPVQVGIRTTTSDFNSRTTTSNWTSTTAGTGNTDRCRFRNTVEPPSGRTYTWTPDYCSGAVTAGTIGGTSSICSGTGTTLTLSGQSSASYGISTAWFYSTVSGGPYSNSAGTGTSLATGSLTATRFYVATTTCDNGGTSATTAQFAVNVTPAPTASNAGPDQTICITTPNVTLAANVPGAGTGAWSVVSGPSTSNAQFSSTAANDATFTPAGGAGTYTLRWTISNAPCTASTNDVQIIVRALHQQRPWADLRRSVPQPPPRHWVVTPLPQALVLGAW
ncbi:MAG: hypothetical protein IPP26_09650 [Flavobacteriales bacterium]|nr:hypothetical protein [Flavobacteriales bacterium]